MGTVAKSFMRKGFLIYEEICNYLVLYSMRRPLIVYYIQHCFICRPSDSTVPTDAGIEPRTVATGPLAVRRSNH